MLDYTPEAARAIESNQRFFGHRLLVDWNNDGGFDHPLSDLSRFVTRTSRDQAISSTAPEELMLIEGYGSAAMEVEIAGNFRGLPLTTQFAPYNGKSIFFTEGLSLGVSIYYEIGVSTEDNWEWFRQFTGVVREVEAIRESGIVKLDCQDNVEKLRTSMDIHAYGVPKRYLQDGYKRGALVDSSSIIDMAARTGGFTMGPEPGIGHQDSNTRTVLSVPFHGSILPEIGQLDEAQEFHLTEDWYGSSREWRAEAYTAGPHGYLALNGVPHDRTDWGVKKYWVTEETEAGFAEELGHIFGCWVHWDGPGTLGANCEVIGVRIRQSDFVLVVNADGWVGTRVRPQTNGSPGAPIDGSWLQLKNGWNYIQASFFYNWRYDYAPKTVVTRTRVNDTRTEPLTLGPSPEIADDSLSGIVTVRNWLPISDLEYTFSRYTNAIDAIDKNTRVLDTAEVDWGRNRMMYTLRETARPAWEIAKEVTAAEYGVVWFDERGKFRFWNFESVTAQHSEVNRYFDLNHVEGLSMRTTMDSVRNLWSVTTRTGYSDSGIFYDLSTDGEPWATLDRSGWIGPEEELWKSPFNPAANPDPSVARTSFYYIKAKPNLMCPHPFSAGTRAEFGEWDEYTPIHGKKVYQGTDYVGDNWGGDGNNNGWIDEDHFSTEQKWVRRDLVRLATRNPMTGPIGYWLVGKDQGRFRLKATQVYEDDPVTWSVSTTDVANWAEDPDSEYGQSIGRYGERIIELGNNFWLQDRFQTEAMLRKIIQKFGRPIPVTDAITVAGDPRVQIGDVIEVNDWQGMGARIRLQVYGVTREFEDGSGLTDTYQVEVIETPGEGRWDDPQYGIWDQSLIWS